MCDKYTVTPFMGSDQIGDAYEVTHAELVQMADAYNYGRLGHCDAWFEVHVNGELTDVSEFY